MVQSFVQEEEYMLAMITKKYSHKTIMLAYTSYAYRINQAQLNNCAVSTPNYNKLEKLIEQLTQEQKDVKA